LKRAIIYGVGKNYLDYLEEIENNFEVVGYMDTYKTELNGKTMLNPDNLEIDFDFILITPYGCKSEIATMLMGKGIPANKLIPYYGKSAMIDMEELTIEKNAIRVQNDFLSFELKSQSDESVYRTVFVRGEYDF